MKKTISYGIIIIFLLFIAIVSAQQHGVTICTTDYNCGASDSVCPIDFGADCTYGINCDPDCIYADETECNCLLQGKTYLSWYGCCGDDTAANFWENNPYQATELSCTDNHDNNCNLLTDCQDNSACPANPPSSCHETICSGAPTWDWSYNLECNGDTCAIESNSWCTECSSCEDGFCADDCTGTQEETAGNCPQDCGCTPETTQLCNQNGVCIGSFQTCEEPGVWPGCDYSGISGWQLTETLCDGLDNDCDGTTDEGCDSDGDDYCDDNMEIVEDSDLSITCFKTDTTSTTTIEATDDCNDNNWFINPEGIETCGNGADYNCDDIVNDFGEGNDCGETGTDCEGLIECLSQTETQCNSNGEDCGTCCFCNQTGNLTFDPTGMGGDCADIPCPGDACGLGLGTCTIYQWADFPDSITSTCIALNTCQDDITSCIADCAQFDDDSDGYSNQCGDCNDTNASINPEATQICGNGIWEDCVTDPVCGCTDYDGDSYAFEGGACGPVDCDDNNASINPGIDETYTEENDNGYCYDLVDNDCDTDKDFNDTGCKAIVEGFIRDLDKVDLEEANVTAYPPIPRIFTSNESNTMGYYNLTTIAGKYLFSAQKEGYDTDIKEKTVLGYETTTQLNFTLPIGTCHGDCTNYYGRCNRECEGYIDINNDECHFHDNIAMDICQDLKVSTTAIYSVTETTICYLDCCEGIPYCMQRLKVNVTGDVEDLFKRTRIVNYNGRPVKINILVWQ